MQPGRVLHAGPRLDRNTISEVSTAPLASFVSFGTSRGFTQYGGFTTPIHCEYHVSEAEYLERNRAGWPEDPGRTVLVPPASDLNPGDGRPKDGRGGEAEHTREEFDDDEGASEDDA